MSTQTTASSQQRSALAKTNKSLTAPSFLEVGANKGTSGIEGKDLALPFVKLLQPTSVEVNENGLDVGTFFDTIGEVSLGKSIEFLPVLVNIRYTIWGADLDSGILASASDGKNWDIPDKEITMTVAGVDKTFSLGKTVAESGLSSWGTSDPNDSNSAPLATKQYYVIGMFLGEINTHRPFIISLQKSQEKVGKNFASRLAISQHNAFAHVFTVESRLEKNSSGTYYGFKFTGKGYVQEEETYKKAENLFNAFKDKTIGGLPSDASSSSGNVGNVKSDKGASF